MHSIVHTALRISRIRTVRIVCIVCRVRAHEVVACRAGSSVSQASSLQASASPVCTHSVSVHPKLSIWGRTTIVVVLDPEASYYKYIASAEYVK